MFNFFKKQFIDVIEWVETEKGVLAYKFPMQDNEIQTGAKLTVRESQMAMFVNEGQVADVFKAGLHTLKTQNLPLLTNLKNWDKLFESPFKSDVYFFSTLEQIGYKWGTQNPITVSDPQLGAIRIRAFGNYSFKIKDPAAFYKKLSGSHEVYKTNDCETQIIGILVANISSIIASSKVPFLNMAANQIQFSEELKFGLSGKFSDYGLELTQFFIENLSLPESVQEYLDKSSSMNLVGDLKRYTQFQTADAIIKAAQNEGAGGLAALGANVGVGAAIGQAMAQSLNSGNSQTSSGGEDVFQTIEKLHQLLSKGVITQQEFDSKKADLLKKI
jgi:membrane protease subunit (stomatin/prohibitin family)